VTKGAVYHHFASKEDLFRAVHDEVEGEVQLRCAAAGASARAKGPIAQLLKGVDAYLDAALEPDVQRITLVDGPAILGLEAAAAPPGEEAARAGMRAMIQAAIDAGAIRRVDPDSLTHLVRGACMQAGMLIARSDTPAQTRKRIGTTIHALLEGLATT
jgi:AcrR family transcriptional regulator